MAQMAWNNQLKCYEVVSSVDSRKYQIQTQNLYNTPKVFLGHTRFKVTFPTYNLKSNSSGSHSHTLTMNYSLNDGKQTFTYSGSSGSYDENSSSKGILLDNNRSYTLDFGFSALGNCGFTVYSFNKITSSSNFTGPSGGWFYIYINMGLGNYTLSYGSGSMSVPPGRLIGCDVDPSTNTLRWFYKDSFLDRDTGKTYFYDYQSSSLPRASSISSNAVLTEMIVRYI